MTVPAPLTPPDCDLRDFPFMQLDVVRLRDSEAAAGDPVAFQAAVLLWCASWHQLPAASLPNDDVMLARLAGYGRDVRNWKRARAKGALRGFVLCADGRLYHPVVAEKALAAYEARERQRQRTVAARSARLLSTRPTGDLDPASTRVAAGLDPASTVGAAALDPASTDGAVVPKGPRKTGQAVENTQSGGSVTERTTGSKGEEKERRGEESTPPPPSLREGGPPPDVPAPVATGLPLPGQPPPATEARSAHGARLPREWQPDRELCAYAASLGLDPRAVAAQFRDYWHAVPGTKGRKLDWAATWRNWCRREAERHRPRGAPAPAGKLGWMDDEAARLAGRVPPSEPYPGPTIDASFEELPR